MVTVPIVHGSDAAAVKRHQPKAEQTLTCAPAFNNMVVSRVGTDVWLSCACIACCNSGSNASAILAPISSWAETARSASTRDSKKVYFQQRLVSISLVRWCAFDGVVRYLQEFQTEMAATIGTLTNSLTSMVCWWITSCASDLAVIMISESMGISFNVKFRSENGLCKWKAKASALRFQPLGT